MWKDFRNKKVETPETQDVVISILVNNKTAEWFAQTIEENIQKTKKIENPVKRNKLYTNYANIKKIAEEIYTPTKTLNSLFFASNEKVYEYELTKQEQKTIQEYKLREYMCFCETDYKTDYFQDLFDNFEFHFSFIIHKNETIIKKWNENKEQILEQHSKYEKENYEKIRKTYNYKNIIYIYGNQTKQNKDISSFSGPKVLLLEKEEYSRQELHEISQKETMKKNHAQLQQKLQEMQMEKKIDLYVFGKLKFEIKDAIESYLIKELYIQREKYEKLKLWIEDRSAFNFQVFFIEKLQDGDVGDEFIRNYNGVMGIKYF